MPTRKNESKRVEPAQLTRAQLLRMVRATERQLSAWERLGWIRPAAAADTARDFPRREDRRAGSGPRRPQPRYSFGDVSALRTILKLRQGGVPARLLRSLMEELRSRYEPSGGATPWEDLRVETHGKRLAVSYRGARMEPLTGQLLLEFSPYQERSNLRPIDSGPHRRSSGADQRAYADRLFLAGLRYEERPETLPKAIRAYKKAIELNPRAVGAFINLGTIYYHQGGLHEAERYYRAALALNPASALVHFNLGNLLEELGQTDAARSQYEEAIRLDPQYPDPRFNLALVFERQGRHGKAGQQWRAYLKLDAESRWAAYARQKLAQIPLRVVPTAHHSQDRGAKPCRG
jgi:tetratricopeptide (TPR) repeat protein